MIVELPTAPSVYRGYASVVKNKTFYQEHELAIWTVAVLLLLVTFLASLSNNAELLWNISTPLMKVLP